MISGVQRLSISHFDEVRHARQSLPWSPNYYVRWLTWAWRPGRAGWQCVGMGSGQGSARTWCCRVHFLRTIRPHPLTLSPYVQMLARGIAGALGWIRRPHRGRESRGGHGRGWPATQLPAQVSTGRHEQLFLPLLLIPSMLKAALPPTQIQQWQNWWTKWQLKWDTYLFTLHCLYILTERQSYVAYTVYTTLWLFTTGIGVEVRFSQIISICGCFWSVVGNVCKRNEKWSSGFYC